MNKIFVKTQNVKNFIGLVENLQNKPKTSLKWGLYMANQGLENHKLLCGLPASMTGFIFEPQTL